MTKLHVTLGPSLTSRRNRQIDISAGAKVRVNRWDGRTSLCTIDDSGLDEKNGRTVISFTDNTWAYLDQIESGSAPKPGSHEVSLYQSRDDEDGWDD